MKSTNVTVQWKISSYMFECRTPSLCIEFHDLGQAFKRKLVSLTKIVSGELTHHFEELFRIHPFGRRKIGSGLSE